MKYMVLLRYSIMYHGKEQGQLREVRGKGEIKEK